MYYAHMFFVIVCSILAIVNIAIMLRYAREFPLVIPFNGVIALFCGFAAFVNFILL